MRESTQLGEARAEGAGPGCAGQDSIRGEILERLCRQFPGEHAGSLASEKGTTTLIQCNITIGIGNSQGVQWKLLCQPCPAVCQPQGL